MVTSANNPKGLVWPIFNGLFCNIGSPCLRKLFN